MNNTEHFRFCWPCISIYLCNKNQLDALFNLSLFRQSTSTCFGHICSPAGGIFYIYNNWYVLCFLVGCWFVGLCWNSSASSWFLTENVNTVMPVNEVLLEQLTTVPQMINQLSAFYWTWSFFTLFKNVLHFLPKRYQINLVHDLPSKFLESFSALFEGARYDYIDIRLSLCLSARLSAWNNASTAGSTFVKFCISGFTKIRW